MSNLFGISEQETFRFLVVGVDTVIDSISQTMAIRRDKGLEAALAGETRTGRAAQALLDAQPILADIENTEARLLKQRDTGAQDAADTTFDTIKYGTAGCFLLLAVVGYFIGRSIIRPIRSAVSALASSASEILAGTTQQAAGTQEQATAVAETATTVDEIVQTSEQANERAKAVAESSRRALEEGPAGRQAVEETIAVMGTVREQTEALARNILGLAEQAQAIGEIIATVTDMADQTNLLALNAAIEASRAGEQGRGFTVVAAEIKALADQSKKSTVQVRQILGEIQKATNSAVIATEDGARSVNRTGQTIKALAETISDAAVAATQITASVGQEAIGMAQIQQAMHNISVTTNQNLATTRQAERAAQDLDALGISLKRLLVGRE